MNSLWLLLSPPSPTPTRNILRQDTGTGSDELRILQSGWMLFLKIFSDKELKWLGATKQYQSLPYNPALVKQAKALRKAGILHEALLWNELKSKKLHGLDFDCQNIEGVIAFLSNHPTLTGTPPMEGN